MPDYVDWFVDREEQRKRFLQMLADETRKRIMVVKAPPDMGKSWLILRIRHDCRTRAVPVAHLNFLDDLTWDYLTIVRKARDDLGPAAFNHLTRVINQLTGKQVQVNVEQLNVSVNIQNSQISDSPINVAATDVIGDEFNVVQAESEAARRNIEFRVTEAFFVCLSALAEGEKVVFLIDSVESAPPEAMRWIQTQLLLRIRDGQSPNVIVVMAGRETPDLQDAWREVVGRVSLDRFEEAHIRDYLLKRDLAALMERPGFVDALVLTGGAYPKNLAEMIELARINTGAEKDDDW